MRRLLSLILLSALAHASIALRGTNTGPNPNGSTITTNLPASTANNDFVAVAVVANAVATAGAVPWATPSGWTAAPNSDAGGYAIFYKIWHTGDATSVTMTPQNSAGSWETSVSIAYSGVDTSTPIDQSNCTYTDTTSTGMSTSIYRAPATFPSFTTSEVVAFYFNSNAGGVTINLPGALTSQVNQAPGPTIRVGDIALSSATSPGNYDATVSSNFKHMGCQLLLHPSGAAAATPAPQPTVSATYTNNGTATFDLGNMWIQAGDVVIIACNGASLAPTSSFTFTQAYSTGGGASGSLYYGTYVSGSTSLVFNPVGGCSVGITLLRNTRDATTINYDTSAVNNAASSTTVATTSLTPADAASSILLVQYDAPSTSGTWTLPGGLALYADNTNSGLSLSTEQGPSSPTGTFTGTFGSSHNLSAGAAIFNLAVAASVAPSGPWVIR